VMSQRPGFSMRSMADGLAEGLMQPLAPFVEEVGGFTGSSESSGMSAHSRLYSTGEIAYPRF
jgi:hypothetical protein